MSAGRKKKLVRLSSSLLGQSIYQSIYHVCVNSFSLLSKSDSLILLHQYSTNTPTDKLIVCYFVVVQCGLWIQDTKDLVNELEGVVVDVVNFCKTITHCLYKLLVLDHIYCSLLIFVFFLLFLQQIFSSFFKSISKKNTLQPL